MNGCPYLTLARRPNKRGRPRRHTRRRAMCAANLDEIRPCEQYAHMRGERCHIYRAKRKEVPHD